MVHTDRGCGRCASNCNAASLSAHGFSERQLVTLRKQQRETIEEIKKKTNYYSTRTLIERYDEGPGADTPLRRRIPMQGLPGTPSATPQRAPTPQPPKVVTPQTPAQVSSNLQQHLSRMCCSSCNESHSTEREPCAASPQRPIPPPRKQWYDKLADAILGDDDTSNAAASRYALICQRCFAHNGLVKESLWEDTRESTARFRHDKFTLIALTPESFYSL